MLSSEASDEAQEFPLFLPRNEHEDYQTAQLLVSIIPRQVRVL